MTQKEDFVFTSIVLALLCLQHTGHALLTRYSQGVLREQYSSTEVVLVGEIIKLIFSAYFVIYGKEESDVPGAGFSKFSWLILNARKMMVLVLTYSFGNVLVYYALARVDAASFTVTLQLKTFTTAAFAVLLLGRNISATKWRALILLVVGCVLVASPSFNPSCTEPPKLKADEVHLSFTETLLGFGSLLLNVTLSGFAAVYFEKILKTSNENLGVWERNFQLSFYSMILMVIVIIYQSNLSQISNTGKLETLETKSSKSSRGYLFHGWTINTVLITITQSGGGLLVAATLKYSDAIVKTLATALSIVITAILGYLLLGGKLDVFVILGSISTILAIFNYTLDTTSITQ